MPYRDRASRERYDQHHPDAAQRQAFRGKIDSQPRTSGLQGAGEHRGSWPNEGRGNEGRGNEGRGNEGRNNEGRNNENRGDGGRRDAHDASVVGAVPAHGTKPAG